MKIPRLLSVWLMLSSCITYAAQAQDLKGDALLGSLKARQIGSATMSGRVSDIDGVASNPKIIYVGAAAGGVWKSLNGGTTFRPVFEDYPQSIGKICIDQAHPDTVWVGTGEPWVRNSVSVGKGIYRTTNGGTSWQLMGLEDTERIGDIAINPKNPNIVYVAALGHLWNPNKERGLYRTTDGGKTWERILFVDENTGCTDIEIDPRNPDVLYASFWEYRRQAFSFSSGGKGSAVFKSIDGGKTWNKIHTGLPKGDLGRMAIALAPSKPDVIYLTVEAKKEDKGLYKSIDAGATWKRVASDFNLTVRPFYFSRLTVSPVNDSVVFKPGLNLVMSKDGGEKFRAIASGVHSDAHAVWINPKMPDQIYVATDGGVYRSLDGAYDFEHLGNLPLSQFYHVSTDDATPYNVYGGLQDNGSWFAPSSGAEGGVQNKDWRNVGGGDGFWVYPHPSDHNIIFWESQGGSLNRYDVRTRQNKDIKPLVGKDEPKLRFNWNSPMHISPNNPKRMYFAAQYLFMSEDMGETWARVSPDLTTNDKGKQQQDKSGGLSVDNSSAENHCTIYTIAESPKDEKLIAVGTDDGNLQITEDGGKTWRNLTPAITGLPKNTWVSHVEWSRHDRNVLYATFDGHTQGDKKTYIYKSADLGKTWANLATADVESFAHCVREDLKNPDLLFVGTEFGLFISIDAGKSWFRFKNNLPMTPVRYITIQPRTNDLVLATHGRGIVIIDNITPLRELTQEVIAKNIHFFDIKPIEITAPAGGQEFNGAGEFVGENPPASAQITYYLKKRHTFGDMFLEIFDEQGKLITKLPAGKSAGINRVEWQTRLKAPKTAVGATLTVGALFGPSLPEGKYTIRMTKGKEQFTTTAEIITAPSLGFTAEERKIQQVSVMKLYDMTERLAYITRNVQSMKKHAEQTAKQSKRMAKSLETLAKDLEAFNKTLVITTGDNYVETAEDQLRERISNLYAAVNGYLGKPSNAQLDNLKALEREMTEVEKKFDEFTKKRILALNQSLAKDKLPEFKIQTWEEFKAQAD